jgi:hypothetical protein
MRFKLEADEVMDSYASALRRIASLTGFNQATIVRGEAGIILKTCAGRTKVSSQEQIDRGTRLHVARRLGLTGGGQVSINVGIRGQHPGGVVWFHTKNDHYQKAGDVDLASGRVTFANLHFRRGDWKQIVDAINAYRSDYRTRAPLARRAEGLARQSWVQIADDLGINLESVRGGTLSAAGIAKARAAIATTGMAYRNGQGTQFEEASSFFVRLTNSLPFGDRLGFDGMILLVISGRVKLFERSYAKGAFDSIEKAARNFPYLRITAPPGIAT